MADRPPSTPDDAGNSKIRRITLSVYETDYNLICRLATTDGGLHPSDYCANLLREAALQRAKDLETIGDKIPHLKILLKDRAGREQEQVFEALKRIAARHIKSPSEQSMEELKSLCEEESITVEEIMDDLADSPAVPVVVNSGNAVARASNWIIEFMKGKDSVPSAKAFEESRISGFSKRVIEIAKQRLDIRSEKKGAIWYWVNDKPFQDRVRHIMEEVTPQGRKP